MAFHLPCFLQRTEMDVPREGARRRRIIKRIIWISLLAVAVP